MTDITGPVLRSRAGPPKFRTYSPCNRHYGNKDRAVFEHGHAIHCVSAFRKTLRRAGSQPSFCRRIMESGLTGHYDRDDENQV
ncbi:hypothetical protein [uncultured Croceicoccus sp.]|uniref:hypothetical protein n=1 Tax=uncultured Croceicoccus sp. TaxID=1295329 RepID=UPI002638E233|nr:hypothetical protein [uncultured Croceicoccus sp.]